MPLAKGKHRGFVFTAWDMEWTADDYEKKLTNVTYLTIGLEVCPDTGRLHHQGAVYFKNPRAASGVLKCLPAGTHLEPAKGNELANQVYTQKDGNLVIEIGQPPNQGARCDLEGIRERILDGESPRDIALTPGADLKTIQFSEVMFRLAGNGEKRTWKPDVVWLWGAAGRGKTHIAKSLLGVPENEDVWHSGCNLDYWQDYHGHRDIWLEEFRGSKCKFNELLEFLGDGPCRVNIKYASCELLAERIVITSAMHPRDCYPGCAENVNQLLRRIDVCWEINALYDAADQKDTKFPALRFFPQFEESVRTCAGTRRVVPNPIRWENGKKLSLCPITNLWLPEQKSGVILEPQCRLDAPPPEVLPDPEVPNPDLATASPRVANIALPSDDEMDELFAAAAEEPPKHICTLTTFRGRTACTDCGKRVYA